ncbi:MAG: hypothetical protein AB7S68_26010, partial [Polyangiaceae bacterium]
AARATARMERPETRLSPANHATKTAENSPLHAPSAVLRFNARAKIQRFHSHEIHSDSRCEWREEINRAEASIWL